MSLAVRTWGWIAQQARDLDALLIAEGAGVSSPRNFSSPQTCVSALDLVLEPLSHDNELARAGATFVAVTIAREPMPSEARPHATTLEAGTPLTLEGGTNAVCDVGLETAAYAVDAGPRRGTLIAFSDDLRLGLGPLLAREALRRTDQVALGRPLDEAGQQRILDWLEALAKDLESNL